jgi:hypothetical protein
MMVLTSTPYKRSGLLQDRWKDCYGKDDDRTLVIQASSQQLNPLIDPAEVEADREKDPLAAKSEWDGIWRDDVSAFVGLDVLEDAIDEGVTHRPPRRSQRYHGYVDQSGGAGSDSMVLAITHFEDGYHWVDLVVEKRPPFSASDAVQEFCAACKGYRITTVYGARRLAVIWQTGHGHNSTQLGSRLNSFRRRPSLERVRPPRRSFCPTTSLPPNGQDPLCRARLRRGLC